MPRKIALLVFTLSRFRASSFALACIFLSVTACVPDTNPTHYSAFISIHAPEADTEQVRRLLADLARSIAVDENARITSIRFLSRAQEHAENCHVRTTRLVSLDADVFSFNNGKVAEGIQAFVLNCRKSPLDEEAVFSFSPMHFPYEGPGAIERAFGGYVHDVKGVRRLLAEGRARARRRRSN